jgi:hypothetical protein
MHKLTIVHPEGGNDNGSFRISFSSPDLKRVIADEMKTNMSGNEIRDRIKKYFEAGELGTTVKRTDFDAEGNETGDSSKAAKTVYDISLDRLVAAPSTSNASIMKGSSKA